MYLFPGGSFRTTESLEPPRNKKTSDIIRYGTSTWLTILLFCYSLVVCIALQATDTGNTVEGVNDISPLLQVQYDDNTYDLQYSSTVDITHVMKGCLEHITKTIKGQICRHIMLYYSMPYISGTRAPKLPRKPVLKPLAATGDTNDAVTSDNKSHTLPTKEMKRQQRHEEKVAQWTEMYNAVVQVYNILMLSSSMYLIYNCTFCR